MSPPSGALAFRHGRVQRARRLLTRASARQAEGAFVVEGVKLVGEALGAGAALEAVFAAPEADAAVPAGLIDRAMAAGVRVYDLAPGVMERLADTVTPQPVLAIARTLGHTLADLKGDGVVLVCVDVRDPGNLGTVLRSAEAAGAGGVVCCDGTVDVYNPKCVRASAGSLFHVRVVAGGDAVQVLDELGTWGVRRLATQARGGTPYDRVDLRRPVAFLLGNEAHGLPAEVTGSVDEHVTIPMAGRAESLNVGMAAALLCFEAARRGPVPQGRASQGQASQGQASQDRAFQ